MAGGQDAHPTPFNEEFDRNREKLLRHLTIEVHAIYKAWGRALDAAQLADEVQDLWLRIVNASGSFDATRGSFRSWANKIAMYHLADRQREFFSEKRRPAVNNRASLGDERTFDLLIESRLVREESRHSSETIDLLLGEIDRLPERERVAIRRRFLEQSEYACIAKELGVGVPRARHIVSEGLRRLSDRLRAALRLVPR